MYTVDIDTGGTMTDGLVWDGETMITVKVDTTPHDLVVSFASSSARPPASWATATCRPSWTRWR